MIEQLTYLYGKPDIMADLRTCNEDFQVQEILPFVPSGEGEHHLLYVRKSGLNTVQVAKQLAQFAQVHPKDVTYAGQKDKNAVTEQWFGVRIPGKLTPNWSELNSPELTILSSNRHQKKLRIGALSGNRFTLTLRNVSDMTLLAQRLEMIQAGVPNYFGEQRFGHGFANIERGRTMLSGKKIKDRNKRSMYLSALRSNLFNLLASRRLEKYGIQPIAGDCVLLAGTRSFFVAETWDQTLLTRLAQRDILLSVPLWGKGELAACEQAKSFEHSLLENERLAADCNGLAEAGLSQERRALLLYPEAFKYQVLDSNTVQLEFILPAGCFATSVLRELTQYQDVQQKQFDVENSNYQQDKV